MCSCFLNAAETKHKSILVTQLTLFWDSKLLIIPYYLFIKAVKQNILFMEMNLSKQKSQLNIFVMVIYTLMQNLSSVTWWCMSTLLYINSWRLHLTQKLHKKDSTSVTSHNLFIELSAKTINMQQTEILWLSTHQCVVSSKLQLTWEIQCFK